MANPKPNPKQPKSADGLHWDTQAARTTAAQSVDREARTMTVVISAESPVEAWDPLYGYVQRVTLSDGLKYRQGNQGPFVDAHGEDWGMRIGLEQTLGSARGLQVRDSSGGVKEALSVVHFRRGQKGDDAMDLYDDGHLTDVSMRFGYDSRKATYIEPKQTKTVKGREFTAGEVPMLVVAQAVVTEVSAVGIGADPRARAQSEGWEAAGLRDKENDDMGDENNQAAGEPGGAQVPPVTPAAQAATPSNVIDLDTARTQGAQAERARITAIQALGAKVGCDDTIVQQAINEGKTPEQAAMYFIDKQKAAAKPLPQGVGQINVPDAERFSAQALAGGLVGTMGGDYAQSFYDRESKRGKDDATQAEKMLDRGRKYWAGVGLQSAVMAAVEMDTGKRVWDIREAMQLAKQSMARAAFGLSEARQDGLSGASLSYVLDVGLNTIVMRGWDTAPETYTKWTRRQPCRNYLTQERVGLQHASRIRRRAEGTAAKHNTFSDKRETYKVYEHAGRIVIDQQAIINDDLGMLMRLGALEGAAARRVVGDAAYTPLMTNPTMSDSLALFHATHRNLATSGSAISIANIQAAYSAILGQYIGSDKDKVNLNIPPKYIITGVTKAPDAWAAINSQQVMKTGGNSVTTWAPANILTRYGLEVIAEGRISNGFTNPVTDEAIDGDANIWFMTVDPAQGETVELGFIDALGEEPLITSELLSDGMFGVQYIVQITVGAGVNAFEGMYKATGAS